MRPSGVTWGHAGTRGGFRGQVGTRGWDMGWGASMVEWVTLGTRCGFRGQVGARGWDMGWV